VKIPPALLRILLAVAASYVVICVFAWFMQRKLMYFPDTAAVAPLSGTGMQDVTLKTSDGIDIKASWWPGKRKVALLLFHGNAGHRGHRFDWMGVFHSLGHPVLMLDYRGYGGSGGEPSEDGLNRDADAAIAWLKKNAPDKKIVYMGESIGASVAVACAARHAPAGLVLQSSALDLADVAAYHHPYLPTGLIMNDRFDARDLAGKLAVPLLSIHGDEDTIIPMKFGRALYDAAPGPKEWYEVKGAGHNDVIPRGGTPYYQRIATFLSEIEKS